MAETGATWEITCAKGDMKLWKTGGIKQQENDIGYDWPGKAVDASAKDAKRNKKGKKKHKADDREM